MDSRKFEGYPTREIDAYELVQAIIDTKRDCLILLDAYIPDRFHDLWRNSASVVQIVAKGQTREDTDGNRVSHDPGDFTHSLVGTIDAFLRAINGPVQLDTRLVCTTENFGGYQKPLTLPELLIKRDTARASRYRDVDSDDEEAERVRLDKKMSSTIRRIQPIGTPGHFVIAPRHVRATKKIEFFYRPKQGHAESITTVKNTAAEFKAEKAESSDGESQEDQDEGVDVSDSSEQEEAKVVEEVEAGEVAEDAADGGDGTLFV